MKAVVYNVKPFENEFLAKANKKKHDITLISNSLNTDTIGYAIGKNTVIVTESDEITGAVIEKLAALGVKYLVTRSTKTDHIDKTTAFSFGLKLANLPFFSPLPQNAQANADQVIKNLDLWESGKCVGKACVSAKNCAQQDSDIK